MTSIRGVVVPLITPFKPDLSLDLDALGELTHWIIERGVDLLFPMGGSGEFRTLSIEERLDLIDCVVESAAGRVPVYPNIGADTVEQTLQLSRRAEKAGADGVGIVYPEAFVSSPDQINRFYRRIDSEINLPFLLYDPAGALEPSDARDLAGQTRHFKAMKYRTTDGERMGRMARALSGDIALLSGVETVFLQDLSIGAVGCVGGGANFYPSWLTELQRRFETGDIAGARKLQYSINAALEIVERIPWPLGGKIVLRELGLPVEPVTRVEHPRPDQADVDAVRQFAGRLR